MAGKDQCYITNASGEYLNATVKWDSTAASNSQVTVYTNVSSTGGWRLKKGSTVYFDKVGNFTGSFQGTIGSTYQFQLWDKVEQKYQVDNFTLTNDSGGSGGSETPSIPGIPSIPEYGFVLLFSENDYIWDSFPEPMYGLKTEEYVSTLTLPTPRRDTTQEEFTFTITGYANGGGQDSTATAKRIIKTIYSGSWNTLANGKGNSYDFGSSQGLSVFLSGVLYAQQTYEDLSPTYQNNSVSVLTIPEPPQSKSKTYTITYEPSGGTLEQLSEVVEENITYSFVKWTKDQEGLIDASELTVTSPTVYAQWQENKEGGTLVLPQPTKLGYVFRGWSEYSDGSEMKPAGYTLEVSKDLKLFAFWEKKSLGNIYIHDGVQWKRVLT